MQSDVVCIGAEGQTICTNVDASYDMRIKNFARGYRIYRHPHAPSEPAPQVSRRVGAARGVRLNRQNIGGTACQATRKASKPFRVLLALLSERLGRMLFLPTRSGHLPRPADTKRTILNGRNR
jgi:hypothetical protein